MEIISDDTCMNVSHKAGVPSTVTDFMTLLILFFLKKKDFLAQLMENVIGAFRIIAVYLGSNFPQRLIISAKMLTIGCF